MPAPHLDVELPRRESALVLPRCREIVTNLLALEGWQLRDPTLLAYSPTVDDNDCVHMRITNPLKAQIDGQWLPGSSTMRFSIVQMDMAIPSGSTEWPLTTLPRRTSAARLPNSVSYNPTSPRFQPPPPPAPRPRDQRVIEL